MHSLRALLLSGLIACISCSLGAAARATGRFNCDCRNIDTDVRLNATRAGGDEDPVSNPSWGGSGTGTVGPVYADGSANDPTCVLPCWLLDTGLPMTNQDLQEVRTSCYLPGAEIPGAEEFLTADDRLMPECKNQGSTPTVMQGPSCAPGFTCTWRMNVCNMNTWPMFCTAQPECNILRLGSVLCDEPQNAQEPFLCPEGKVCTHRHNWRRSDDPDDEEYQAVLDCPSGSFCPAGTYDVRCALRCTWLRECALADSLPSPRPPALPRHRKPRSPSSATVCRTAHRDLRPQGSTPSFSSCSSSTSSS